MVNRNYNLVHLHPKLNSIFPTRFSYTPKKGHEVYTSYLKERVSFGSAFTKVILWEQWSNKNAKLRVSTMNPTLLVVSTHLKNMSQIGSFPQVRMNI